ncbi:hypothetical protein [Streptosporangium sandarakinum]|uniref:hypothetical protein n=1 Tax=Streptosporangium sandarakinum TaxID=1260955 RepID=UPI0037110A1B
MLLDRVAVNVEVTMPGALDLTGSLAMVDVRAAAVEELGQRVRRIGHAHDHLVEASYSTTVLISMMRSMPSGAGIVVSSTVGRRPAIRP